jgi:hypothetical protein
MGRDMSSAFRCVIRRFEIEKMEDKLPYRAEIRKIYPIEASGDVDAYKNVTMCVEYDALGTKGEVCYIVVFKPFSLYGAQCERISL